MDVNEYVLEVLVRDRLAEMRAEGQQSNRIQAAWSKSHSRRLALRHAFIRMRQRLHDVLGSSRVTIDARGAVETRRTSTHGAARG